MKYSKGYFNHVNSYYSRHLDKKIFESPLKLQKHIADQKNGQNNIIKIARAYLNYCEQLQKLPANLIEQYRKVLKVQRSNPDYHVPSNEEVIETFNQIKDHSVLEIIYLVLATSGIRYVEALEFLKTYDPDKFVVHENHVSYNVSELRHNKNINNIYLPLFVYKKLIKVDSTYQALRVKYRKKTANFSLKYLRKWHYNLMIYHGVPESVADFIQGRSNKSVSANHYLARSQQADYWYEKIKDTFIKYLNVER